MAKFVVCIFYFCSCCRMHLSWFIICMHSKLANRLGQQPHSLTGCIMLGIDCRQVASCLVPSVSAELWRPNLSAENWFAELVCRICLPNWNLRDVCGKTPGCRIPPTPCDCRKLVCRIGKIGLHKLGSHRLPLSLGVPSPPRPLCLPNWVASFRPKPS